MKQMIRNIENLLSGKKREEPPRKPNMDMTNCAEGFRINEELLGRVMAYKRTGDLYESDNVICLSHSIERPVDYGVNLLRWLTVIKSERKRLKTQMIEKDKMERENNIKDREERAKKALAVRKEFLDNFFRPLVKQTN